MDVRGLDLINGFYRRKLTTAELATRPHPGTALESCQCEECYRWLHSLNWHTTDTLMSKISANFVPSASEDLVMRDQFEYLMENPEDRRYEKVKSILLEAFRENSVPVTKPKAVAA